MKFNKFEYILVWRKSKSLIKEIYKTFLNNRDYAFRDQIQRASVSVMNNIAEGYERSGNKEFKRFLYISKGSVAEVRSMLYLAVELNFINESKFQELNLTCIEIAKMLSGLIKTL